MNFSGLFTKRKAAVAAAPKRDQKTGQGQPAAVGGPAFQSVGAATAGTATTGADSAAPTVAAPADPLTADPAAAAESAQNEQRQREEAAVAQEQAVGEAPEPAPPDTDEPPDSAALAPPTDAAASPQFVAAVQDVQTRALEMGQLTERLSQLLWKYGEVAMLDRAHGDKLNSLERSSREIKELTTGFVAELQGTLGLATDDTEPINEVGGQLTAWFARLGTVARDFGAASLEAGEAQAGAEFLALADRAQVGSAWKDHPAQMPGLHANEDLEAQSVVGNLEIMRKQITEQARTKQRWFQLADAGVNVAKIAGAFSAGALGAVLSPSLAAAGSIVGLYTAIMKYRRGKISAKKLRKLGVTLSEGDLAELAKQGADIAENQVAAAKVSLSAGAFALVGVGVSLLAPPAAAVVMVLGAILGVAGATIIAKRWLDKRASIAEAGDAVIGEYLDGSGEGQRRARTLIIESGGSKQVKAFEEARSQHFPEAVPPATESGANAGDTSDATPEDRRDPQASGALPPGVSGGYGGLRQYHRSVLEYDLARPVGLHLRQRAKSQVSFLAASLLDSLSCGVPSREVEVEQLLTGFDLNPAQLREDSQRPDKRPKAISKVYDKIKAAVM